MSELHITDEVTIYNDMPKGWKRGKDQPTWHKKVYDMWRHMWARVYTRPDWFGCLIHPSFKYLSNYVGFIMSEPRFEEFTLTCDKVSWTIDKDAKDPNNRNYYPEYMTLCTKSENTQERNSRRGNPNPKVPIIGIKGDSVILLKSMFDGDAKRFNNGNISLCLNKKRKTHKGYKWYKVNYKHNKTYRIKKG